MTQAVSRQAVELLRALPLRNLEFLPRAIRPFPLPGSFHPLPAEAAGAML
jgi:hypothetical protein